MTVIRRAIDLTLATLVTAVLVIGLSAFLAPHAGARLLAIRTGSMEPTMPVGSLVVATEHDPADLVVGDAITVSLDGGTALTHRISTIVQQDDRRMFQLKGDANPAPDPVLVMPDQILGRVDLSVPILGYLLAMMSMPTGIAGLLSIGAVLLTAGWLLDELDDAEAEDEDADERDADQRLAALDNGKVPAARARGGGLDRLGYEAGRGQR